MNSIPDHPEEFNQNAQTIESARIAIAGLLQGELDSDIEIDGLGSFAECYSEMRSAFEEDGPAAAKKVFDCYAAEFTSIAALIASCSNKQKTSWTVGELLSTKFPEPDWLIKDFIPTGYISFSGRPKIGKSWGGIQLAHNIGSGQEMLQREIKKRKVLYLALEDNARRLKQRLELQGADKDSDVIFVTEWKCFDSGGLIDLVQEIEQKRYSVIFIDTISRALGRSDQMDQAKMTSVLGSLQQLTIRYNVSIIAIDHHRKGAGRNGGDHIDDTIGATSKISVADTVMSLYRERGAQQAVLKITGRDVGDQELALRFEETTAQWVYMGDAECIQKSTLKTDIILALEEHGGKACAKEIASFLKKRPNNITRALREMVRQGIVRECAKEGVMVPYELIR